MQIEEFVNYTKLQSESYATSNLIMTMGRLFLMSLFLCELQIQFPNVDFVKHISISILQTWQDEKLRIIALFQAVS